MFWKFPHNLFLSANMLILILNGIVPPDIGILFGVGELNQYLLSVVRRIGIKIMYFVTVVLEVLNNPLLKPLL
jgi:hypothetical protein